MWVSPEFELRVIDTFDTLVTGQIRLLNEQLGSANNLLNEKLSYLRSDQVIIDAKCERIKYLENALDSKNAEITELRTRPAPAGWPATVAAEPEPTATLEKPSDIPDLPIIAGGYYALVRNVPCLQIGDSVFLALSPTCRAIGTAPACYHQSAAAREGSFLTSLSYRGQTRKLLMVPISYWAEKLNRARLRQPARGQLGGLLQEVRSGLFATVH